MALDKFYGTKNKFKELIDLFHQNGIAVILDIEIMHLVEIHWLEYGWKIQIIMVGVNQA